MDAHPTSVYTAMLRRPTWETLDLLPQRKGIVFTEYEREAFERLKRALFSKKP